MAWSSDGTQLGGASGSGQIIMARIVERYNIWAINVTVQFVCDNKTNGLVSFGSSSD